MPWLRGSQWLSIPGALAAVQHLAPTGRWAGTTARDTKLVTGRSGDAWLWARGPAGVVTTIVCLFITIQRVA
jgi:hypothetical protein